MSLQFHYEQFEDPEEEDPSTASSSEDGEAGSSRHNTQYGYRAPEGHGNRTRLPFDDHWPKTIGVLQLTLGFILATLGLCEILLLPMLRLDDGGKLALCTSNAYGAGIWAGVLLILSGSYGLRAGLHRSVSAVFVFFMLVLLNIVLFSGLCILLLVGYTHKWTTPSAYDDSGASFDVHLAVTVLAVCGLALYITSFTQYFEDVCCSNAQMGRRIAHRCCPCFCPRVAHSEELLDENTTDAVTSDRPPVVPV